MPVFTRAMAAAAKAASKAVGVATGAAKDFAINQAKSVAQGKTPPAFKGLAHMPVYFKHTTRKFHGGKKNRKTRSRKSNK